MANEITVGISIAVSKGGLSDARAESFKVTMTGDGITHSMQTATTSWVLLVEAAAVGTAGWYFVKNLDGTNFVELGPADNQFSIKLKAGESTVFRASDPIGVKADTASCNVEYLVIED
jgi:hypothetical protein